MAKKKKKKESKKVTITKNGRKKRVFRINLWLWVGRKGWSTSYNPTEDDAEKSD